MCSMSQLYPSIDHRSYLQNGSLADRCTYKFLLQILSSLISSQNIRTLFLTPFIKYMDEKRNLSLFNEQKLNDFLIY